MRYFSRILTAFVVGFVVSPIQAADHRVTRDLQVLYTFAAPTGDVIHDQSGIKPPIDLKIDDPNAVRWTTGVLAIQAKANIRSQGSARLADAIKRSGNVSLEAWVKPANTRQAGPARVISLSSNTSSRNVTLGQDGEYYEVRFRTTSTSGNGLPALSSPGRSATTELTHIVYTRGKSGQARIYVNGKQAAATQVKGDVSNWDRDFPVLLANEATGDRPWLGEIHLVAIYSGELTPQEVAQNFQAGGGAVATPSMLATAEKPKVDSRAKGFEVHIAPLLAKRCLHCHDTTTKEGGLDLSLKSAAMAGGEHGNTIVPGKPDSSLLWKQIAAGEMPPDSEPLADAEKRLIRQWIEDGAVWSGELIDQAIYEHADSAAEVFVQRLTVDEYIETVRAAVGVDIEADARRLLPPDLRADGFSNTAYNLNVDLEHVEAYEQLARLIVERMDVAEFASRFSKQRSLNTDASARQFVEAIGKWMLRGPLTKREEVLYSGIGTTVSSAGGSFEDGVALLVEAMLQSPRFLYRIEDQRGESAIGEYELASRLSYIIWGGPPDEALIQAADKRKLSDRQEIEAQAQRMLNDPRAIRRSERFIADWLDVDRLANMQPNPQRFPAWTPELAADMRAESLAYFREIIWTERRPMSDLFNAQVTYATPRLAEFYGLKPQGSGLQRYDLAQVPSRGGLLTQGSLLTIGGDDASMVTRGLFVLKDVLRGSVGNPPPGLDVTPVPSRPGLSQRTVAQSRIAAESCSGCHSKFEPLAFGLERFSGIGAYREKDEFGNSLREDGEVLFPGESKPVPYKTSAELMDLLAKSERVRESLTWKVTQFAIGRPLTARDADVVRDIHNRSQKNGGTYQSVITAIVTSDLMQVQ